MIYYVQMTSLLAAVALVTTNCAETAAAYADSSTTARAFAITGTVLRCSYYGTQYHLWLQDDSGFTYVANSLLTNAPLARAGDRVFAAGLLSRHPRGKIGPNLNRVEILAHGKPPSFATVPLAEIAAGRCDFRPVYTEGTVYDAFQDDIDRNFAILAVEDAGRRLYVSTATAVNPTARLVKLIGAKVRLFGYSDSIIKENRRYLARNFSLAPGGLEVLSAPADPFAVPDIASINPATPENITGTGRLRLRGTVIAAWNRSRLLVKLGEFDFSEVDLSGGPAPAVGETIEAAGLATTDLNQINLYRAVWRPCAIPRLDVGAVCDLDAEKPVSDSADGPIFNMHLNGRRVCIEGEVVEADPGSLVLRSGGRLFTVRIPAGAAPERGTILRCDTICHLLTERWVPEAPFPRTTGLELIVNDPRDLEILVRPPWWTPHRVLALVGALFALLIASGFWSISLRRLANRRGRALAEEEVRRAEASIKIGERTRLAVELHDSISQNLTAVSFELDTAKLFAGRHENNGTLRHLDIAGLALDSCRTELRNCLWDLRHEALDLDDFAEAIRQTLAQHIGDAQLKVRFHLPRERLTDITAHLLLRAIRELVSNAVRHGHAKKIAVAGTVESGRLFVSVSDNGTGFDPASAPGIDEGHYGLEGIRERIENLDGEVEVESVLGKGTRVILRFTLPRELPT